MFDHIESYWTEAIQVNIYAWLTKKSIIIREEYKVLIEHSGGNGNDKKKKVDIYLKEERFAHYIIKRQGPDMPE